MVVVNPASTANLKPTPTTTPKPAQNPLEDYIPHVYNPVENIVRDRNEDALISKNKEIIRAKYYQLTELLGNYDAIKKAFDMRGYYLPPESYFHPEILEAGGVMDAATSVASTVIGGIAEGIASVFPRAAAAQPTPTAELLDPQQQVTLIRTMNDVIAQVKAYFDFRAPKVTPTHEQKEETPTTTTTGIPVSATPTVVIPQTVTIPPEILRPLRPQRPVRIRTRDLKTNLKPVEEEEDTSQDWTKPVRKFRDDYAKSQITEGDYADYIPPSGSSSSSSSSSGRPILDLTSFGSAGKPILDLTKFPPKSRFGTPIDLEQTEKPKYIKPTQTNTAVVGSIQRIVKALFSDSWGGLLRIKLEKGKSQTKTQVTEAIKDTIKGKESDKLQQGILGLLNLYGITVKSKYMEGEVVKVIEKLMEMNPQMLNTFMNELIKLLEASPKNKLTFLFEPVATDSGTLAVEGAPPIYTRVNLRDSRLRQSVIDKLKEEKVPEADTIKWYDTLIDSINEQNHERYKASGGENNEKGREQSRKLLFDNIQAMLLQLEIARKTKFNTTLVRDLVRLIFNTFKEPITVDVIREIIDTPIYETVAEQLDPTQEAGTPRLPDITEANRVIQNMFGYRIYYDTVMNWKGIEIVKAPRNPDLPPPPDGDPDDPPLTQYYWIRKNGRPWTKVNIRVIILIISVISASSAIAYEIIKAIKDEHDKKEDTPEPTPKKEEPKPKKEEPTPKKEEPEQPKPRPKRTKRHGDLP